MNNITINNLYTLEETIAADLFNDITYPWEVLPKIKSYIKKLLDEPPAGFTVLKEGVLIGENVKISPTATIEPPAVLGAGTEVRPGAYIRGNVITGADCVIGNSS